MGKIKIGIIGAGGRANFQTRAIVESGIGEPVIVYSPFEEEVKKFAEKYKIAYTTSIEEILENKEIEGVTISTPNSTHYDISKKFLLNNKNVLVEYPPTLKTEEVDELINIAKERNLVYWVSLTQLLQNPYITIKKNLNLIGDVLFSFYSWTSPYLRGWYKEPELCGNIYAWQHYHFISQLVELFGSVKDVSAYKFFETDEEGKYKFTYSTITMKFKNKTISHIAFSMGVPQTYRDYCIEFVGSEGSFLFYNGKLFLKNKDGDKEIEMEKTNPSSDTENFLKAIIKKEANVEKAIEAKESLKICVIAERKSGESYGT
ncbi:Gfo/Idh/MocA family oxidoreductase [bacterium]|nr:Gfo/Idh/MocA family oxidoreductase [bacterium]